MATFDSKDIVRTIMENDGYYPGDPQAYHVVEYTNMAGNKCWHVAMSAYEAQGVYDSPFCKDPVILWHCVSQLSEAGKEFLENG